MLVLTREGKRKLGGIWFEGFFSLKATAVFISLPFAGWVEVLRNNKAIFVISFLAYYREKEEDTSATVSHLQHARHTGSVLSPPSLQLSEHIYHPSTFLQTQVPFTAEKSERGAPWVGHRDG